MNDAHLHLLVNHLPIVGAMLSLPLFGLALLMPKDRGALRAAVLVAVFTALGGVAADLTGEPAEEVVEGLPDVTEDAKPKPQFTAYGITQEDDPLSQAMRGLIDNAASQEHQIALLWQAIERLSDCVKTGDCVPGDAALKEQFEAGKLNDLVGK